MKSANKKTITMIITLSALMLFSGCTNWKKKYNNLNVEHQNLKGLFERERAEKGQLREQVASSGQTIQELQQKIAERNQSPAEATGFGEGYDVAFDPAAGTITVTLESSILFSPGQASLKKATNTELDHIYSVLQSKYPNKLVDVIGHTDSDPIKKSKWKDNWELSAQRALSVLRYLTRRGAPGEKIRAVGRGASDPIASNTSVSGKAKNRRVEIVVHMR